MRQYEHLQQSEVAILGKGVESVLRRLIRFLVGKISLAKLHQLIDFIYVEELEDKLRKEHPKRQVTLSMMALNTGLDTRVISRIRNSASYKKSLVSEAEFFRSFTPAASFLHLWSSDPRFTDPETGKPMPLPVEGAEPSLEQLAGVMKLPRGVTIKSVIKQLESSNLVSYDRTTGQVTMRVDRYLPSPGKDREGAMEIGFVAVSRLLDTVLENLNPDLDDEDRLYQRVYWAYRLSPQRKLELRQQLVKLLDSVEKDAYQVLSEFDQEVDMPDQVSAGFGLYLFEDIADENLGGNTPKP